MLFDQPTSALDPELVGEVLNVMRSLAKEGMTIIVTHNRALAREVAKPIVFMDGGVVVERAADIIDHPTSLGLRTSYSTYASSLLQLQKRTLMNSAYVFWTRLIAPPSREERTLIGVVSVRFHEGACSNPAKAAGWIRFAQ